MFSIFPKLNWFIRTHARRYAFAISMLILSYVLIMVPPRIIGQLADQIKTNSITKASLYQSLGIFLGAIILSFIINYIWSYNLFIGADQLRRDTRRLLMKKFLRQSPIFFEKNTTGSLMGKSTNDVNAVGDFAGFGFMSLVDATLYPLALVLIMGFTISWRMTFFSILPLPILIFTTRYLEKKIIKYFTEAQESFDRMNDKVLENVSGVRVVRSYVREEYEKEQFRETSKDNFNKNFKFQRVIAVFGPIGRMIPAISLIIALSVGSFYIQKGTITLGEMISFTVYLNLLIWPMFAFGEFITVSKEAIAAIDRIQELWDYKEEIVEPKAPIVFQGHGDICFKDYSFRYPTSKDDVLKNIDLVLKEGQTLGIVGKIGSGKTAFVKQLLHLYPAQPDSLFFNGKAVEDYNVQSLRSHIGYVPQQHILFSKTIEENILLGARSADKELIQKSVEAADFKKDLAQLPHGLETMTGEKGIALSGGQKQRISIARALIGDPAILILDDSLSAVDASTEARILENIRRLRAGKTNVITAHRLSAVAHADQIIVLEQGEIIQRGTHQQLYEQEGWYREQFLHQQLEGDDDETE